jgi:hypothetical protein
MPGLLRSAPPAIGKCRQVSEKCGGFVLSWTPTRISNSCKLPALFGLEHDMTLSLAVLSAPDETATIATSEPQTTGFHLEPRCHVCRNDEVRKKVNDLLASGASYAMTLRALGDDSAVGVTSDSIRRHSERHFPVQNVARATYREILERRAKENSVDFIEGVATAITPMALLETVMVKGYETVVDPDTKIDAKTGMLAACRLQELIDSCEGQVDMARMWADMDQIIQVVKTLIPSERWPEVQAALRGEAPIRQQQARPGESIRMVEIDDMPDEDAY